MMTTNNPSLDLAPIIVPESVNWFPLAWGWWVVISGVVFLFIIISLFIKSRAKRLQAKKTALRLLTDPDVSHTPSSALQVLRQVTFSYFPREEVAALTGSAWYQFLDSHSKDSRFVDKQQQWQAALYQNSQTEQDQELIDDCIFWVKHALPVKKKAKIRD
ncbi:hypothetical protein VAZ01S_060_00230 [Vibrio azureus NBRC 104587]|uniref:DUF4381 domain-containing protein n=2 Tax=Vibrio azureus TaxID=512649 RepID=U3CFK0_9VIBR|nr:hypothetical protein VAZ01S_060_00230 [Vibrio azureus NBRC 104587]